MTLSKEKFIIYTALSLSAILIIQTFIAQSEARLFLPMFFGIGICVGMLRLFVNSNIKKMKGKSIFVKILFFSILLGIGLPFQNWFRVNVLLSMNSDILPRSIAMLILGLLFLTFLFNYLLFVKLS